MFTLHPRPAISVVQGARQPARTTWRRLQTIALLAGIVSCSSITAAPDTAASEPKTTVYSAGIAYLGSFQFIDANYPNALRLNRMEAAMPGRMDRELATALKARPPQSLDVQFGLADLHAGETIVFALAIDHEYLSREQYRLGGRLQTKLIAEVSAQALFFNVDSQSLIANFPLAIAFNHVVPGDAVPQSEIDALFDRLYLGRAGEVGFIASAVDQLSRIQLKNNFGFRFQVADVTLQPEVVKLLPSSLTAAQLQQSIGQLFSAQLSSRYAIRVLPYVRGYAIGRQIPGRFANGKAFNLAVPEPDFLFRINLAKLGKFDDRTSWLYSAQAHFTFAESSLERTLADDDFRYAVPKLKGDSVGTTDDWGAYEDAVENLLTDLTQQLGAPNRAWVAEHARNPQTYQQLQLKKELFDAQSR